MQNSDTVASGWQRFALAPPAVLNFLYRTALGSVDFPSSLHKLCPPMPAVITYWPMVIEKRNKVRMLLGLWFRAGQMGVSGTSRDMYWFEARQNQWPIFLQMSKQTQPECIECLTIMDHTWTRRHHDKHQEQLAHERYAQVCCDRQSRCAVVPAGGTVQKLRSRLPFSWWGFLMLFCVETTYILLMSCARFPEMVLRKSKRTPRKIPGSRKHVAEYGKS